MSALPADIAAATREATLGGWTSQPIRDRYPGARESYSPPSEGFFDSAAHAEAAAAQRGALIGVERRRFTAPVHDLLWIDPTTGIPTYRLKDAAQTADLPVIPARVEVDLEAGTTTLELFG